METRRDVFQAIADPTRRKIIDLVAGEKQNLNAIAGNFDMSRQAISLHIKILSECGLIVIRKQGRERYCEAKLKKLGEVSTWLEQYRKIYEAKLDSLETYLGKLQSKNTKYGKQKSNR
ncbi:helix-turn-helix transcriptional regulator [Panacibacter ginsenosidivorans]|uniref:Helix-turn-helix transcriptional regulator n=1 Tax=Panacibacter ginsenosidivorans TaxID=1813871 RepID=A0A5B8V6V8_9BACT|nr:metalloregulator ArsR/SmtB family transcription factor [Panacibacter ginsenosidivorans]QEC67164.1 helix-turn-helix transcriptional regulator [Panacibacter ginsenosidivorans]